MRCYVYDEFNITHSPCGCVCSLDMYFDNVRLFHYIKIRDEKEL